MMANSLFVRHGMWTPIQDTGEAHSIAPNLIFISSLGSAFSGAADLSELTGPQLIFLSSGSDSRWNLGFS